MEVPIALKPVYLWSCAPCMFANSTYRLAQNEAFVKQNHQIGLNIHLPLAHTYISHKPSRLSDMPQMCYAKGILYR